jgi:isoleucyl-tRNA synthetase
MSDSNYTVALDLELTDELRQEGIARELVNKIQNLRKDKDFEVTDKINIELAQTDYIATAIDIYNEYICGEVLANTLVLIGDINTEDTIDIDLHTIKIKLSK